MNNIYKVIWSKAKNCYVVASEIARSHTKSASGSEKIGGVTRRSLLASLMALSLLCGGLGVASAADGTVHVEDIAATATSKEVYTADKVDTLIGKKIDKDLADATYAKSSDVATNTANINNLDGKLANLTTTVSGKADTDLSNLTAAGETKIKNTMLADMDLKANKADVNTALDGKADKATVTDLATKVGDASSGLVKDVADLKTQGNDLNTVIGNKADQSDLDAAKAKITTNETNITALQTKTTGLSADGKSLNSMNRVETDALKVTGEISNGAGVTTTLAKIDESMKQTETNKGDIANLKSKTDTQQTWIGRLNERTTQISYDPAKGTTVNGVDFMAAEVDAHGKGLTGVTTLNTTGDATIGGALIAAGVNAGTEAITGGSLSVTGAVKGSSVDAGSGEIKTTGVVNAGTLSTTGDATVGGELNANGKVSGNGLDAKTGAITGGSLSVTGAVKGSSVDAGSGEIKTTGAVNAGTLNTTGDATVGGDLSAKNTEIAGTLHATGETQLDDKLTVKGEATFKDKVTMEKDLEVKGELKTDKISMKNTDTDPDGTIHRSATTITADGITHIGEVEKSGVITKSQFTHTEEGSETYAKKGDATDWTETRSDVTADGVNTEVKDSKGNRTNTSQTASENKTYLEDEDSKNTNSTIDTAKGYDKTIKGENGETSTKQDELDITNTAQKGTITNDAKDIVNNATGNLTTTVGGNELHEVAGTKTENVAGMVKENYSNGQETNVTGNQDIHVTGKQTNKIDGDQENTIGGDQTTTVEGNVKEDYKKDLTTTVGGNELHEVTGTKTENVTGMVKENYSNGQETNVTGNQDIHVTGKQTNKIDGDQENTIGGDQTTTVTGDISNTAENITNEAKTSLTDKVGTNTRVINSSSITDTVGRANRMIEDGKLTDNAGDSTVTTEKDKGTTFTKRGSMAYRDGGPTDTNISGNTITTGKVTMDYADVMKDLGVHGNAKVDQNLEVGGTSTLKGDVTMESNAKVKKDLTVEGTTTTKTLKVTENAEIDGTLKVAKKATFEDSVSIAKDLSVGGDVTANSYKVGDKTYISAAGINANDQKITNVADGSISEGSKDAVNGGQLYTVKNDLEGKVNKVGANAAAMANLHPMEFDPDSKWNIAAAIGNYGSETAAALGAFYRPNDDVMVNLSTAFGTGENMVGGGVSVRLGKGGNKLSREETNALKAQVADLTARMDALLSVLNPNMPKDFPDVPENHWAYEAVSRLAGNDIVQGYPDGEFHGERTMTRYEMAEIIYNALSRGAEAEKELVEEFKPELQAMAASEKATAERAEG